MNEIKMEITLEEELLIQQALAIAILAIEQAPDPDKARASYLLHGDPAAMKKLLEKYVGEDWTLAEVTKTARRILGLDDRESDKDSMQWHCSCQSPRGQYHVGRPRSAFLHHEDRGQARLAAGAVSTGRGVGQMRNPGKSPRRTQHRSA
jgi:hypothetical protein